MIYWRNVSKEGLQPQFLADVEAFLTASPYHWYVTSAYRSSAEQDKLYAQGRTTPGPRVTNARGGQSAHNFGLAIDVVLDADPEKPGLQPGWDTKLAGWLWIKSAIWPHPRLQSGWSFGDWPHIQRYRWRNFR